MDSHPPTANPCCGFELMKMRASAICASLSMTNASSRRARREQCREKAGENT
jgi:hypothetical protein